MGMKFSGVWGPYTNEDCYSCAKSHIQQRDDCDEGKFVCSEGHYIAGVSEKDKGCELPIGKHWVATYEEAITEKTAYT